MSCKSVGRQLDRELFLPISVIFTPSPSLSLSSHAQVTMISCLSPPHLIPISAPSLWKFCCKQKRHEADTAAVVSEDEWHCHWLLLSVATRWSRYKKCCHKIQVLDFVTWQNRRHQHTLPLQRHARLSNGRVKRWFISLFMLLSHITLLDLACCLHCLTLLVGSASEASTCNKWCRFSWEFFEGGERWPYMDRITTAWQVFEVHQYSAHTLCSEKHSHLCSFISLRKK